MTADALAGTLADATLAGVYRLAPGRREALLAAARRQGLATASVALAGVTDKPGFLKAVAAALKFPDWFGENWDALDDCLGDLSWLDAKGYLILLGHCQALQRSDPATLAQALAVFADAARVWGRQAVPMWVLVDAPLAGIAEFPDRG